MMDGWDHLLVSSIVGYHVLGQPPILDRGSELIFSPIYSTVEVRMGLDPLSRQGQRQAVPVNQRPLHLIAPHHLLTRGVVLFSISQ